MERTSVLKYLGRALITGIFISAGISKIRDREGTLGYMKSKKLPANSLTLNGAIAMEAGVGTLLALGVRPRWSASALAAFLIPTTLVFHDFWRLEGQERQMQMINFFKNAAIIGGLLGFAVLDLEEVRSAGARITEEMGLQDGRGLGYLDDTASGEIEYVEGRRWVS